MSLQKISMPYEFSPRLVLAPPTFSILDTWKGIMRLMKKQLISLILPSLPINLAKFHFNLKSIYITHLLNLFHSSTTLFLIVNHYYPISLMSLNFNVLYKLLQALLFFQHVHYLLTSSSLTTPRGTSSSKGGSVSGLRKMSRQLVTDSVPFLGPTQGQRYVTSLAVPSKCSPGTSDGSSGRSVRFPSLTVICWGWENVVIA